MKNFILLLIVAFTFVGCGVNEHLSYNENQQQTSVQLSKANFIVVAKVKGEATATYWFGIGGIKEKALVEMAKADMLSKANILGKPRAIINVTSEIHHLGVLSPIYYRKTVIVSGHVIEFTDK